MLKWVIFGVVGLLVVVFAIKVIRTMLKIEKQDKQSTKEEVQQQEEYIPEEVPIDVHSSSAGIVADMSTKTSENENTAEYDFNSMTGFSDHDDEEFFDYSAHVRNHKGRRRPKQMDFDLEGDLADDFEYQPSNFGYLNPQMRKSNKKKPVSTELNELSTELKVLMLSDIFDRKFFD